MTEVKVNQEKLKEVKERYRGVRGMVKEKAGVIPVFGPLCVLDSSKVDAKLLNI